MTGYSKLNYEDENYVINMEIKSVNNKNLATKIKLPYNLNLLESYIRGEIASLISRGSIDFRIEFENKNESLKNLKYDENLAKSCMDILNKMEEDFNDKFSNKLDFLNSVSNNNYTSLIGQALYDNLDTSKSSNVQLQALQAFFMLEEESKQVNEIQRLISLNTTGLGVSYFNVLDRINALDNIVTSNIKNASNIIFKDNLSEKVYPLKIKSIAQNPDSINLTYPVTFTFLNLEKNEKFLSGQTGTVTISVKNNGNQEILIPLDALFEDNGSNVYLFKNGIAVKTAVEIGELRETNKISIVKGLKSGDKVIVAGVSKLADGEKVKILGGTQ